MKHTPEWALPAIIGSLATLLMVSVILNICLLTQALGRPIWYTDYVTTIVEQQKFKSGEKHG